jgi:NADPH:quinone reductase-like Zn-dependent oxidoreductase
MKKNNAVFLDAPGQDSQFPPLRTGTAEMPELESDDSVLVRLLLRPVNPSDVSSCSGVYPGFNRGRVYPATPGLEGVGVVEETGPSAKKFKAGDRVVAAGWGAVEGKGTWQQYRAVPESVLVPVPDSIPDEVAAQFIVNPATCYGFLEVLQIPQGQWFLQSAANSELGRMMVSLCKHRGIRSINIVRRQEAAEEIKAAGGDAVIVDEGETDLAAEVKGITEGSMAYGAIDPVAGTMTGRLASAVRPEGQVLVFGALGGRQSDAISVRDTLFRGVIVTGFWLGRFMRSLDDAGRQRVLADVMELLVKKVFKPRAGDIFPLEKVNEAIQASLQSGRSGKVLLSS